MSKTPEPGASLLPVDGWSGLPTCLGRLFYIYYRKTFVYDTRTRQHHARPSPIHEL